MTDIDEIKDVEEKVFDTLDDVRDNTFTGYSRGTEGTKPRIASIINVISSPFHMIKNTKYWHHMKQC